MSGNELGLALFQRAVYGTTGKGIGFDRLTPQELAEIVRYEDAQLERVASERESVDQAWRQRLHLGVRGLALAALGKRKAAA